MSPSGYTFVALLKACAKHKDLRRGSELHAEVVSMGLLSKDVFVGSALVAMYAKCDKLAKAQEVFDQLPIRNVVSWNALIAGYTKHGHGEKALHFLEKMQLDGVSPTSITFICSLKACASIEAIDKGSEIHVEIARRGLLKESSHICGALVDMYAKCGFLEKAQEVLVDKLVNQSVDAWNALISGYVKHMRGDEALHCFEQMQLKGILPDAITFACTLKACGRSRDAEIGCQIHIECARKGLLETDALLGSSLVDMYFKCGFLAKAQEVFDRLLVRDAVSWTTLIAGYADHDYGVEALICFEQMQLEGLLADSITFACSLKACGCIEAIVEGREIHAEIERRGLLQSEVSVGHAVVDMYAKCGLFIEAFEVLHRISKQDIVLWNVLIAGYANHERGEEALNCLECIHLEGVSPDAITFACSLKACGSIAATDMGREIHAEVVSKGLMEGCLSVGNALIDMYGKCGLLAEAHNVLDSLPIQDTVSWNALIAGYANHIKGEEALNCVEQMQSDGVAPNNITFSSILKACGSIQAADKGFEIHTELVTRGLLLEDTNLVLCSMMVDMYAKCGFLKEAQQVFDKLPFQSPLSWNALISGYVDEGREDEALQLLEQMQLKGVLLDDITFTCSLKACGSVGATDKGRDLHAEIERIGFFESNIVGIALVEMYVKFYLLAKAQEVFDKLPVREVVTWNALICGLAKHGRGEDALNCLQQMQLEGVHPNAITFTGLLKACGSIGARMKGREIHAVIRSQRYFERDLFVNNALVDMYAKCEWFGKARELFEMLPVRNTVSWNALIAAYAKLNCGIDALMHFKQMQSEGVLPDTITLACSLKACGSIGALSEGIEIHAEAERKRLMDRDSLVGNALVDLYAKHGLLAKAQEVFDKLPIQDVVSWNALITGYLKFDYFEEALSCFEQMQLEGVCFDAISFVCSLKACGSIGALDKGQVIHAEIERDGLLGGDLNVVSSLIDMYAKCGSLIKAMEVFNSLQNRDIISWNAFIAGHAQLGESENVFRILNRMEGEGIKPDSVTCLCILSACNHEGLVDKAETYFNVMRKNWEITPTVEHHTCMIDLLGRAGQLDRAATLIKEIPFHPDIAILCSFLGACRKWGSVELATQAFEQAVLGDENDVVAHVYMFNIYADADVQEDVKQFNIYANVDMHEDAHQFTIRQC